MNLEELNKHQTLLLATLISFVTSIATGIATVALLEEAPVTVTQTVNRVVERTIERVVTGTSTPEKPAPIQTVTKEVTVYAKEDDLIVAAVEKNASRVAMIYRGSSTSSQAFAVTGVVVSRDGVVVTDRSATSVEADCPLGATCEPNRYAVQLAGREYDARVILEDQLGGSPILALKLVLGPDESVDAVSFGRSDPKLAQALISIGGERSDDVLRVAMGRTLYAEVTGSTTPARVGGYVTAPMLAASRAGSLIVNLDGQAVGVVVTERNSTYIYPMALILEALRTPEMPEVP